MRKLKSKPVGGRYFLLGGLVLVIGLSSLAVLQRAKMRDRAHRDPAFKTVLGAQLFHDMRLSRDGAQSCASCHQEAHAFTDGQARFGASRGAVSLGQDGHSFGTRNAPSLTYAALAPALYYDAEEGLYKGGFFHDGRADTLEQQALMPFFDPVEMQMSKPELARRLRQYYRADFLKIMPQDVFDDDQALLSQVGALIATFERDPSFSTFDSKFDRVLRGAARFTPQEQRGHDLFIAKDKGNCAACHVMPGKNSAAQDRLLTDFTYDNLGVPVNETVRRLAGKDPADHDRGLAANPHVENEDLRGAFKVPSLRNVAVTGPYMHNGVFAQLSTVVTFYNDRDVAGARNPETGQPWARAEIDATKNTDEMGDLGLSDDEIEDIVAFLKTLTDQRYEALVNQ